MKISDLTPDSRNANKGTAKGQKAIVNSIQRSGAGRSIVVDKNGRIIGGNKTTEAIAEVYGADAEVMVIETTGDKLLVHKRNDLDLDDPDPNNPARQLAYADNLTSWASFELDPAVVMADIEAGFNFEDIDISLPDLGELLDKSTAALLGGEEDNNYVRNIEPPEYVTTGEKPDISQLYDTTKTDKLLVEIEAASIPEADKEFLRHAAQRHTIFNFKYLAEYYAHANEELQDLMENSALVIIDFNKAISLGFVQLTKEIAELVKEEYGDD